MGGASTVEAESLRSDVSPGLGNSSRHKSSRSPDSSRKGRRPRRGCDFTSKTVEFHLTRVYRKLEIHSRSELVRRMAHNEPEHARRSRTPKRARHAHRMSSGAERQPLRATVRTPAEHTYVAVGSSLSFRVRWFGLFKRPGGTGGDSLPSLVVTRNEGVRGSSPRVGSGDLQGFLPA